MSHSHKHSPAMLEAASERKSGRVVFDDSGHTVWEWQLATGVFTRHVNDEQMNRLNASDLQLVEPSAKQKEVGRVIYESTQAMNKATFARTGSMPAMKRRRANESTGMFGRFWRLVFSN